MLVGPDPERPARDRVYIGEGEHVIDRLLAHDRDPDKDFWSRVVFFVSKDENLTKAHVRFLERALIERSQAAGRCALVNAAHSNVRLCQSGSRPTWSSFLDK